MVINIKKSSMITKKTKIIGGVLAAAVVFSVVMVGNSSLFEGRFMLRSSKLTQLNRASSCKLDKGTYFRIKKYPNTLVSKVVSDVPSDVITKITTNVPTGDASPLVTYAVTNIPSTATTRTSSGLPLTEVISGYVATPDGSTVATRYTTPGTSSVTSRILSRVSSKTTSLVPLSKKYLGNCKLSDFKKINIK